MKLLSKIQNKLNGEPVAKTTGSAKESIKSLNSLPDHEKLKVLDYLQSLKDLHKHKHKDE